MAPGVPFDSALLGEVIEHQVNPGAVLETAAGFVRPGGALVVSTPYGLLPYHDHKDPIYLETLVELLPDTLQLEEIELLDRYLCCVIRVLGPGDAAPREPPYRIMLALAEERLRRQDAEVVRASDRLTQLRDDLKAARDTIDDLRARAAGHASAAVELERLMSRHADAEARVQQMGEQLNEARLDARTHRMHRERLERERESLQRDLDARDAHLRELRKATQDHEQDAAVARAELSVFKRRLAGLEKQAERLSAGQESEAARVAAASRLREREQQLARLIEERDALGAQLEDVRHAAAVSADRESALRKRANEAKEEAVRLRVERDKLAGMLETQDQRLAKAEQRARDLAAELNRQSAVAATATAQVEQLRATGLAQPTDP
jgi:chromosome segregation ATPase